MDKELQIEGGNYTRIVNKIIDELVKTPLLGAELSICFFVIRKTYGYHKKEDEISLSQFEEGVKRSRPTVVKALKNLQLVNILQLVKVGNSKMASNIWKFNKYYKTWQLVKPSQLVKNRAPTSKEKLFQLVKTPLHTKDNTKDNTKDIAGEAPAEIAELIKSFETVNPACQRYYGNTTQRLACENLIKNFGFERVKTIIEKTLPKTNTLEFFPTITTPLQLWEKWASLETSIRKHKNKQDVIISPKAIFSP